LISAGCGRFNFRDVPVDAAPDAPDAAIDADDRAIDPCAATYDKSFGISSYRLETTAVAWDVAERACEADGRGMHLVLFGDSPEMNAVERIEMGTPIWVGLTDRITDGEFVNVTGPMPLFMPWRTDDPSFTGPGCVAFDPNARTYHDVACNTPVAYVCECDGMRAKPGSF
jgi:hypothetical protein